MPIDRSARGTTGAGDPEWSDVSAVAYFRVVDAVRSVVAIENVDAAINQIAQTTLRMVVGRHTLDETLSETDRINVDIREILDRTTTEWGVEVTLVELKDIQLGSFLARESTAAVGAARSGDLAALTTLGTANGTTDTTRTPAP